MIIAVIALVLMAATLVVCLWCCALESQSRFDRVCELERELRKRENEYRKLGIQYSCLEDVHVRFQGEVQDALGKANELSE